MSETIAQTPFIAPEVPYLAPLFPGYQIEFLIAIGGMGAVYCSVQKSLDRTVAIKILPPDLSADQTFRASFEAEAKAMGRLNHPNLVGVYDFGEAGGMLYIIMEFVPGQSIHHSAHGIAIDPMETIHLVSSICHGLAHAHEHGIIHRDIKPANILLELNAQPKIGDFGLARPCDKQFQEGDEIYGTPHYTAPEVVNAPHSVDYRANIFSIGVMLHELLTGKLPADDPRPASGIVRCDPRFDAIIRRATQIVPEYRYSSVSEMAADLSAISTSRIPMAAPPTTVRGAVAPRMGSRSPQARKPGHPQRGNHRASQRQGEASGATSIFKVLGVLGLAAFGYVQYQKSDYASKEAPKIEKASSMEIKDSDNLSLYLVRFSFQGNNGVLLWKAVPGVDLATNRGNTLRSISGHNLSFGALAKTNFVNSDFSVVSIDDGAIPYSEDANDYNKSEITRMLPVLRQ